MTKKLWAVVYLVIMGTFTALAFIVMKFSLTSAIMAVAFIVNLLLLMDTLKGK